MRKPTPTKPCDKCKGTGKVPDLSINAFVCIEARRKYNLSVRKVAAAMKISAGYLSDLENGRRNWTRQLLRQFTLALKRLAVRKNKSAKKD